MFDFGWYAKTGHNVFAAAEFHGIADEIVLRFGHDQN